MERRTPLRAFLRARVTEELTALWRRDADRTDPHRYPGLAAQLGVLDDLSHTLDAGRLPDPLELRILLAGYGHHPDYDPEWVTYA